MESLITKGKEVNIMNENISNNNEEGREIDYCEIPFSVVPVPTRVYVDWMIEQMAKSMYDSLRLSDAPKIE